MHPTRSLRPSLLEPPSAQPSRAPACTSSPYDPADCPQPGLLIGKVTVVEGLFPQEEDLETLWCLEPLVLEALSEEDDLLLCEAHAARASDAYQADTSDPASVADQACDADLTVPEDFLDPGELQAATVSSIVSEGGAR